MEWNNTCLEEEALPLAQQHCVTQFITPLMHQLGNIGLDGIVLSTTLACKACKMVNHIYSFIYISTDSQCEYILLYNTWIQCMCWVIIVKYSTRGLNEATLVSGKIQEKSQLYVFNYGTSIFLHSKPQLYWKINKIIFIYN